MTNTELNNITSHMQLRELSLLHVGIMCNRLVYLQDFWSQFSRKTKMALTGNGHATSAAAAAAAGKDGRTSGQQPNSQQQTLHAILAEGRSSSGPQPPSNSPAACLAAAYTMRRCFSRVTKLLPLRSAVPEAGVPPGQLAGALLDFLEAAAVVCWVPPSSPAVQLAVEQYVASARLAWQQIAADTQQQQQQQPQQQEEEEEEDEKAHMQQQEKQQPPSALQRQQQAELSLGREFLRCCRSLQALVRVRRGCSQPGTWAQLATLSVEQLPAILAAAAADTEEAAGAQQQAQQQTRGSRVTGPSGGSSSGGGGGGGSSSTSGRLRVVWDAWSRGAPEQEQQPHQQQRGPQQPLGEEALDVLLAAAARSLAAGGAQQYLEGLAALVAAAPSQVSSAQPLFTA
jgi:hypothetical protein